eukprot:jgi/Chrzof1/1866/Cz10g24070.t1
MEDTDRPRTQFPRNIQHDCEEVCKKLTADGTFDDIRKKVVAHLNNDPGFANTVKQHVDSSAKFQALDLTKLEHKKRAVAEIHKDIGAALVASASGIVWASLTSESSPIAAEIDLKVHEALCTVLEQEARQPVQHYAPADHRPQ